MNEQPDNFKGGRTGWPPALLQDDSRELARWFSSRPDAREVVERVAAEIREQRERERRHA
jgi:hypothetical protein